MVTIDLWTLWNDLKSAINVKQGGQLRPVDFNSWINVISKELFNEKFAAWEKDQMIVDNLSRPFLVSKPLTTKKTTLNYSLLEYPPDYAYFSSARIFKKPGTDEVVECPSDALDQTEIKTESILSNLCEVIATKVDNARWGSVCTNLLIPPTTDNVKITQYEGGFKIAPKGIGYVTLDYLKHPRKAYLSLTGTNQAYDAANTTQLEWSDTVRGEFLARLQIAYYSFIKEPMGYQIGKDKKETTV